MATKKSKSTSKHRKSKKPTAATKKKTKKMTVKRVVKAKAAKKPAKKAARKTTSARSVRTKKAVVNTQRELNLGIRTKSLGPTGTTSARQSADLQGVSRVEQADSQSVDELIDEGNLFEAGAVAGVQEADSEDETEVHTHEMPEDDVPEEYLDDK